MSTQDSIPIIDFTPWRDGSGKGAVARAIGAACRDVGFFYLTGHGVDPALRGGTFEGAARFFARAEGEKAALHIEKSGLALRGYTPLHGEANAPGQAVDRKESFDIGPEPGPDTPDAPFHGANQWPEDAGFRDTLLRYQDAVIHLATEVIAAISLSLGAREDLFDDRLTHPVSILRLLHYPPRRAGEAEVVGTGAHTDYGFLTVLAQDGIGGLQIQTKSGDWIDAPPREDAFVINIGALVDRLSNGRYTATVHRVVSRTNQDRYSIPFFFHADYDAVIEPLPACLDPGEAARYEPIRCGENMLARYVPTYAHLKALVDERRDR
jgi:isopenicillin N synthase-like dioxygenase